MRMSSSPLVRVLAATLAGALLGAGCLALQVRRAPDVSIPFDQPLPRLLGGFHGMERQGDVTFAWTTPTATVTLAGLDRRVAWRCVVRLRGARAADVPQPVVTVGVDGISRARVTGTNTYEDIDVAVPVSERPGLILTLASSPTFVPGPRDRRELGVQVDQITCRPDSGGVLPSRQALSAAATAGGAFAMLFAVLGAPLWLVVMGTFAMAATQAVALGTGAAMYVPYLGRVPTLAAAPVAAALAASGLIASRLGRPATPAARFVLAYSAAAFYLLLLALLHPSKALVDAVFHAHRLEWVHGGRYFFTQPMPDGVAFPYAIALYVVSSPWMAFTRDHVALLRIVVCAAHVVAGALIYAPVARLWNDRLAGAAAVVLWSLVPQWFVVVGNANLTNTFGQSMATATLLSAALLPLGRRDVPQALLLFALASTAFLSHVSTFPLLAVAMMAVAACYWWRGGEALRAPSAWIAAVAVAAAIFSVVAYYGQFGEVYRSLDRVRGRTAAVSAPAPAAGSGAGAPVRGGPTPPMPARAATAAGVGLQAVGWPIVLLSAIGAWRVLAGRDRLTLTLIAWFATCAAFLAFGVLAPVEDRFYRYTVEFIGRIFYATWPAAIVLAGAGASWTWRAGVVGRAVGVGLVAAAIFLGARQWWGWIG